MEVHCCEAFQPCNRVTMVMAYTLIYIEPECFLNKYFYGKRFCEIWINQINVESRYKCHLSRRDSVMYMRITRYCGKLPDSSMTDLFVESEASPDYVHQSVEDVVAVRFDEQLEWFVLPPLSFEKLHDQTNQGWCPEHMEKIIVVRSLLTPSLLPIQFRNLRKH